MIDEAPTINRPRLVRNRQPVLPDPFRTVTYYDRPWPLGIRLLFLFICCIASWAVVIGCLVLIHDLIQSVIGHG